MRIQPIVATGPCEGKAGHGVSCSRVSPCHAVTNARLGEDVLRADGTSPACSEVSSREDGPAQAYRGG